MSVILRGVYLSNNILINIEIMGEKKLGYILNYVRFIMGGLVGWVLIGVYFNEVNIYKIMINLELCVSYNEYLVNVCGIFFCLVLILKFLWFIM